MLHDISSWIEPNSKASTICLINVMQQPVSSDKPRKMVIVVCACIRTQGGQHVLLSLRRAPGVFGLDGKWELPGGKIEFGESPETTIVREIQEELGIKVIPRRLLPYLHTNVWEYEHLLQHVVLACYDCEFVSNELPSLGPEAHWCHINEIDFETTLPGTKEFISLAVQNDWFESLCIRFVHEDQSSDATKEFTIVAQPTLFSRYGLIKYWGTIGSQLRMRIEEFDSAAELSEQVLQTAKRRLSLGYHIAEFQSSDKASHSFMKIIELAKQRKQYSPPPVC